MRAVGRKRLKFILITAALLLIVLAGAFWYVITEYKVTELAVEGNIHYTNQEVADMVLPGGIRNNSLYLKMWYRNREMPDIPFVETMDVEILSHHKIRVTVYEKALAGCFEYLGMYMYFDKDGIVVESSSQLTEGVPQIKGLSFDHVVLFEQLPVENEDIFSEILKVTQLLDKYELNADQIYFSTIGEVTLYFKQVRVTMGGEDYIDEKVMELKEILPNLEGMSGILHMESFTPETTKVTFVPDNKNAVIQTSEGEGTEEGVEGDGPENDNAENTDGGENGGADTDSVNTGISSGASSTGDVSNAATESAGSSSSGTSGSGTSGSGTSGSGTSGSDTSTSGTSATDTGAGTGDSDNTTNTSGANAGTNAGTDGSGTSNTTATGVDSAASTGAASTTATTADGSAGTQTGGEGAGAADDDGIIEISVVD